MADLTDLLPKESPVCVHDWVYHEIFYVFCCTKCDYVITMKELSLRQEGTGKRRLEGDTK